MATTDTPQVPRQHKLAGDKKRQRVIASRDQFREEAWQHEVNIDAVKAQPHLDEAYRAEALQDLEHKRDNALAAAERMDELLRDMGAGAKPSR